MRRVFIVFCSLAFCLATVVSESCPNGCTCNKAKQQVACSAHLTAVPARIPSYTNDLDLKGNRIRWLRIGDFTGLESLVNLLLNGNQVAGIEPGTFGSLKRVRLVNLRTNNLTSLDEGMFEGLPKTLKTLYLHENQISRIEAGVFTPLSKSTLQVLSLKLNKLTEIKPGDFEGLEKLKNLVVDDNLIQSISSQTFTNLQNIRKLSLNNNQLTQFPSDVTMPVLSVLSLANNKLTSLPDDVFSGMNRLTHINVSSNQINFVGESVFRVLPKLHTVDLSNNHLVRLHDPGNHFTRLLLSANLWRCDCHIQNMRRWIDAIDCDVTCTSPSDLAGESLKNLRIEDLRCESTSTPSTTPTQRPVQTGSNQFFCPAKCVCAMEVRHINCNRRGYAKVPSRLPSSTALLDLRDNRIRVLETNSFLCPRVVSLHLQHNGLQIVRSGAFKHLAQLVYLYLNRNVISNIEPGAFQGLEKLAYLYLDHNRIASLPTAVFRPLVSIYAIYIRRNSLVALRSDSMEGLERLRWLYVTGNRLTHIDDNALESCSSLQRLYLGSNELSEFPARGLAGLPLLNHLDLSANLIDVIPASQYEWMTSIESLDLSSNQIHAIEGGFLDNLTYLKSLNLSNNHLRHLPELAAGITELKLANNSWTCGCKIVPLWRWMNSHQSESVTCFAPTNRLGQILTSIQLSELCSTGGRRSTQFTLHIASLKHCCSAGQIGEQLQSSKVVKKPRKKHGRPQLRKSKTEKSKNR